MQSAIPQKLHSSYRHDLANNILQMSQLLGNQQEQHIENRHLHSSSRGCQVSEKKIQPRTTQTKKILQKSRLKLGKPFVSNNALIFFYYNAVNRA